MDPRTFDGLILRFSGVLSRRSLVGGSLGASVLTALGLRQETLGKNRKRQASAEACIPSGKRCPATRPRGKKKKKLGCDRCCEGQAITVTNSKGKKVRKCGCRAGFSPCTNAAECCSGVCGNGICQLTPCAALGEACAAAIGGGVLTCCFVEDVTSENIPFCSATSPTSPGTCQRCVLLGGACNPSLPFGQCCGFSLCQESSPGATTGTCVAAPTP